MCSDGVAIDLFAQLGGNPDAGGSWSGPSVITGGQFDPATMSAGTYTYTLSATPPCTGDQATVTVTIAPAPDAGSDGSITVCDQGAPVDLFVVLGGTPDAGGTWSGGLANGQYDPVLNDPGTFTYTVTGMAPCGSASATVTVNETGSPNAGTDGAVAVCSDGVAIDLFAQLGGNPDAGGSWSGPSVITGGLFDPAVNTPGQYLYTLSATPPCNMVSSIVMVAVEPAHDPGINGNGTLCTGDAPVQLFDLLGGNPDAGGAWSGPAGAMNGVFDPALSPAGTYSYIFSGGVCPAVSATVEMVVLAGPNAGQDNAVALCAAGPHVNLLGLLAGSPQPGGTWHGPEGELPGGTIDPATAQSGSYTYTVAGNAACPEAQAVLLLSINTLPQAGSDAVLNACSTDDPIQLFSLLGDSPDQGGAWTFMPGNTAHSGIFNPATDPPGNYRYTVPGQAPCPAASATITAILTQAPDAGNDTTATLCSADGTVDMITLLGGAPQPGGTWADASGTTVPGFFTPGITPAGLYRYTLPAVGACGMDLAQLQIDVVAAANAGQGRDSLLCASDAPFSLFTLLSGDYQATGQWTGPGPVTTGGLIDPATAASGAYVYTVTPPAPCPAATAIVNLSIASVPVVAPYAEIAGGCAPVTVVFHSGHQGEGTCHWDFGNGADSTDCGPITFTYQQPGQYTARFTATAANGCAAPVQADIEVLVVAAPVAGFRVVGQAISTGNPTVAFANQSTGAGAYRWDFGGLGNSAAYNGQFTFPQGQEAMYTVCLTAYASPTCADTVCHELLIPASASVHVPNAFTPDGDGQNDTFAPSAYGLDPNDHEFSIFDRWGHLVFITNDPNGRWDGRGINGNPAPQGVYTWKLTGQDMIARTRFEKLGHVTLLR